MVASAFLLQEISAINHFDQAFTAADQQFKKSLMHLQQNENFTRQLLEFAEST